MKVALVHDQIKEFGGGERVLEALCELWPKAPIYTAFVDKNSSAYKRFKDKKIITSWVQNVPFFASKLHSPLRFLAPLIWNSFDFSTFDVVFASSSWYVTKGFKKGTKTIEICYCHTPPRYLYGYPTQIEWQKYWPTRVYGMIVNHFMRVYDFEAAQKVNYFIANSREVQARIEKFYRRDSVVIYPPVDIKKFTVNSRPASPAKRGEQFTEKKKTVNCQLSTDYFLVVSRLVASKNVDIAVQVCARLGLPLKVVGTGRELENLKKLAEQSTVNGQLSTVQFLGEVSDQELILLYQNCQAVIFPASQEDFGLVPVEAMAAGKPVIVNAEGGVLESVIDALPAGPGKGTGVYFDLATPGSLTLAINNFMSLSKKGYFDPKFIRKHAQKFSKDRFKREVLKFVESKMDNAKL